MSDDIKEIIENTAKMTVIRLKKEGLTKSYKKSTFKKTEQLLRSYNNFKKAIILHDCDIEKTKNLVRLIDEALEQINNESGYYAGLLECIYFEKMTREQLAYRFNCEPITITRNKNKMIHKLKDMLFSDEVIDELFFRDCK